MYKLYEEEGNLRIAEAAKKLSSYINKTKNIFVETDSQEMYRALFGSMDGMKSSHLALGIEIDDETTKETLAKSQQPIAGTSQAILETNIYSQIFDVVSQVEIQSTEDTSTVQQSNYESEDEAICKLCGHTYSSTSNLQTHIENVHKGRRYLCSQCSDIFTAKSSLRRHAEKVHPGSILNIETISIFEYEQKDDNNSPDLDNNIRQLEAKVAENENKIAILKGNIDQARKNASKIDASPC